MTNARLSTSTDISRSRTIDASKIWQYKEELFTILMLTSCLSKAAKIIMAKHLSEVEKAQIVAWRELNRPVTEIAERPSFDHFPLSFKVWTETIKEDQQKEQKNHQPHEEKNNTTCSQPEAFSFTSEAEPVLRCINPSHSAYTVIFWRCHVQKAEEDNLCS